PSQNTASAARCRRRNTEPEERKPKAAARRSRIFVSSIETYDLLGASMQKRTASEVLLFWVLSSWLQLSLAQTKEVQPAEPTPPAEWAVWSTVSVILDFYKCNSDTSF